MDSRVHGEDEGDCLRLERYSKVHVRRPSPLSYWTLQAIRSLTCHGGFVERKKLFYVCGSRHSCPAGAAVPLLHRPLSYGFSSPGNIRPKFDPGRCCAPFCFDVRMREFYVNPLASVDLSVMEAFDDQCEHTSCDGASSSVSVDCSSSDAFSLGLGDPGEQVPAEDGSSSTDGSSSLGWPLCRAEKCPSEISATTSKSTLSSGDTVWEEKRETERGEIGMRREKFAKLLLGEDMSGGGKGVSTALAISNAITNLSASVFGELWKLEPLSAERKAMWRREMEWLLSVADYIVELVPSWQAFPDGGGFEVMIGRPRSDLQVNLPALRKLDAMLLESLDSFSVTEFWYVDKGIVVADDDGHGPPLQRQEEKWWLPSPKLPANGLSDEERKRLQHQRECISQILKASVEINSQILSEMEIPCAYWDALPKSGRASLGEAIYRQVASEYFSADAVLCMLDLSTEHDAVEVLNRIEAAVHLWRRRRHLKHTNKLEKDCNKENAKNSWSIVKDFVSTDRREFLAERTETLLLCLKQKFPGLRQSLLDMTKIQYNKDVGQAILESYSRVMESLAFTIIARIDDVLYVDDLNKRTVPPPLPVVKNRNSSSQRQRFPLGAPVTTPFVTPLATPSQTPQGSPNVTLHMDQNPHVLSDSVGHNNGFQNDGNDDNHGQKKSPSEQLSKTRITAKALNNSKAQSIHPVQD